VRECSPASSASAAAFSSCRRSSPSIAASSTILPTVCVGIWRQQRYGNVRWRPALIIGVASVAGVEAGVQIATSVPETTLRRLFAVLVFSVAASIAWRRRHA
jgi:uncharacterized membrane protein YfcA